MGIAFDVVSFRRIVRRILERASEDKTASKQLLTIVTDALHLHPNSSHLYCVLADAYFLSNPGGSDATENYSKAIELDPLNAEAYESLGYVYDAYANYVEAEKCFRKAIAAHQRIDSYLGLADVLIEQGKFHEARSLLDEADECLQSQKGKIELKTAELPSIENEKGAEQIND